MYNCVYILATNAQKAKYGIDNSARFSAIAKCALVAIDYL